MDILIQFKVGGQFIMESKNIGHAFVNHFTISVPILLRQTF